MTSQFDLFGRQRLPPPRYPDTPGHRGGRTQRAAVAGIAPRVKTTRERVLDHIRACGAVGATRPEIAAALDIKLQTVCGRVRELSLAGAIKDSGHDRAGCAAMVAA
jgi:hypothetical protein